MSELFLTCDGPLAGPATTADFGTMGATAAEGMYMRCECTRREMEAAQQGNQPAEVPGMSSFEEMGRRMAQDMEQRTIDAVLKSAHE